MIDPILHPFFTHPLSNAKINKIKKHSLLQAYKKKLVIIKMLNEVEYKNSVK